MLEISSLFEIFPKNFGQSSICSFLLIIDDIRIVTKDSVVISLKEELQQREKLIAEMQKTWEEKLKEAEAIKESRKSALEDMVTCMFDRNLVSSKLFILRIMRDI